MPIRVDYTPVGALGQLAQQAGQNQAAQQSFENALRSRAQSTQATQGLLSYLLQKKQMAEQSRRFDLSREDQQQRFAASMGARSAAIRQSRELADQQFSLQKAASKRATIKTAIDWMNAQTRARTTETPQDKMNREVTTAELKNRIKLKYTAPIAAAEALGDMTKAAMLKDQFKNEMSTYTPEQLATLDTTASELAGRPIQKKTPSKPTMPRSPEVRRAEFDARTAAATWKDARDAVKRHQEYMLSHPTDDPQFLRQDKERLQRLEVEERKAREANEEAQTRLDKTWKTAWNEGNMPGGGSQAQDPSGRKAPKRLTSEDMDTIQGMTYVASQVITSPEAIADKVRHVETMSPQKVTQWVKSQPRQLLQAVSNAEIAAGRGKPDGRRAAALLMLAQEFIQQVQQEQATPQEPQSSPSAPPQYIPGG